MSLPIKVSLVSGSYKAESKKFKRDVTKAFLASINNAYETLDDELIKNKVAFESGQLRKALRKMFSNQLNRINQVSIDTGVKSVIRFNQLQETEKESYFQYHVHGITGSAKSSRPYKKPTKPGTRPIDEFTLMKRFKELINSFLRSAMTKLGLTFTQVIKFG